MTGVIELSAAKRQLVQRMMSGAGPGRACEVARVTPRAPGMIAPISSEQTQLWLHAETAPDVPIYNEPITIHRRGSFDLTVMERSFNEILRRHEIWRTSFEIVEGEIVQRVHPDLQIRLTLNDLTSLPSPERDEEALRMASDDARQRIDLRDAPLFRARVVKLAEDEHRLYLTLHHIIFDGVSLSRVFVPELSAIYDAFSRGACSPLAEAALQYGDYSIWRRQQLASDRIERHMEYWRRNLSGALPKLELADDRAPLVPTYRGLMETFTLSLELAEALKALSRTEGATLYMTLLAAFKAMLFRYTGQEDILLGGVTDLRRRPELQPLIGCFLNTIALRTRPSADLTFRDYLAQVRNSVLGALDASEVPFDRVVRELFVGREPGTHPLFQVMFSMQPLVDAFPDGWDLTQMDVVMGAAKFDLYLELEERPGGVLGRFIYSSDLFKAGTIRRMIGHYLRFLAAAAVDPGAQLGSIRFHDPDDRHKLVSAWNDTARDYPRDASLPAIFRATAKKYAQNTALLLPDTQTRVTYEELDQLSDRWAARLRQEGVGKGQFVALLLPRSIDLIVAILATLKSGAAYVPIEPNTPAERCEFLLNDSEATALLTHTATARQVKAGHTRMITMDAGDDALAAAAIARAEVGGADPAYMMYTSGSTGAPKGVVVPHRAVLRLVLGSDFVRLDETRVIAQLAPAGFDASTFEIWGALLNGGALVVPSGDGLPELSRLRSILKLSGVTTLWLTAALFNMIVDEDPSILSGVEELLTGGEALSVAHVCRALAALPNTMLINGYGPTENTTFTCCYRIPRDFDADWPSVPIGRPIANTKAYILDDRLELAPLGVAGELAVGGDGLSLGYWKRDALNSQSFVTLEVEDVAEKAPLRLYRTGDICRYLQDGSIEFIGRRDDQVKIRGFRIELGEVEAALQALRNVQKAAVIYEKTADSGRLIAFVVPDSEVATSERLMRALRSKLPRHLMPSCVRLLPSLPISKNGKVDRQELMRVSAAQLDGVRNLGPVTATEKELVSIWSDILQRPVTSVEESFFNLGGHSLMAVRLFDRIRRRFGLDLAISTLFNYPTVRDLAEVIDQAAVTNPAGPAILDVNVDWDTSTVIHPGLGDNARPLFIAGGAGGNVNNLVELGRTMGSRRPVIGFQTRGIMGHTPRETIEEMATDNIRHMRRHQAVGPYYLAGYSAGAQIAFEMARQLVASGQTVSEVILLDTYAPGFVASVGSGDHFVVPIHLTWKQRLQHEVGLLRERGISYLTERTHAKLRHLILRGRVLDWMEGIAPILVRSRRTSDAWMTAAQIYKGGPYNGSVTLILSVPVGLREELLLSKFPNLGWDELTNPKRFKRHFISSTHLDMVKGDSARKLAEIIEAELSAAESSS